MRLLMRVACEDGKGCAACGARGSRSTGTRGRELLSAALPGAVEASREEDAGREKDGICAEHRAEGPWGGERRGGLEAALPGVTASSPRAGRGCYSDAEDAGAERSRRAGARTW